MRSRSEDAISQIDPVCRYFVDILVILLTTARPPTLIPGHGIESRVLGPYRMLRYKGETAGTRYRKTGLYVSQHHCYKTVPAEAGFDG